MERAKAIEELRQILQEAMTNPPKDGKIVLHLHGPLIIGLPWDQIARILAGIST